MLSRFVIAFLPRSKCLLISWFQSPSTVILKPKRRKSVIASSEAFYLHVCITSLEKESKDIPPRVFSQSMMPAEVVSTVKPDWWEGYRLFCHYSRSLSYTSNLGLITPQLLSLPVRFTAIFPALRSLTISNSPMYPCFLISVRNLTKTLEHGLIITWHLLLFSALMILLRASARTFMHTIMAAWEDSGKSILPFLHSVKHYVKCFICIYVLDTYKMSKG